MEDDGNWGGYWPEGFAARGMRLWREHIQAGIRRGQENGRVRQNVEYVCYDEPVRTRICETCRGTAYMERGWLIHVPDANKTLSARVECPFGCEGEEDA